MKPTSASAKGKRFERRIAEYIRSSGLDPDAKRETGSGSGSFKGDVRSRIPFLIEAKNEVNVPLWLLHHIDQARDQSSKGFAWKERWMLVLRDPRTPENNSREYAVVDFHEMLEILRMALGLSPRDRDNELMRLCRDLRRNAGEVLKKLGGHTG